MEDTNIKNQQERQIIDLSTIGICEVPCLGKYRYTSAKNSLPEHIHKGCLEICYLEKGKQLYEVKEKEYLIQGGDIFVSFPNEPHSTGKSPESKGVLFWIIIKLQTNQKPFLNFTPDDSQYFIQELLEIHPRQFPGDPTLKELLESIFSIYACQNYPLKKIEISTLLSSFLLRVIKLAKKSLKHQVSPEIEILKKHITLNIEETFSLEELANRVNLSLSRFKSKFKEEIGLPPGEYILREKIEKGKELLNGHGGSITDIAYQLNFSSSQYFATVFKRFTGKTPSEFLKENS